MQTYDAKIPDDSGRYITCERRGGRWWGFVLYGAEGRSRDDLGRSRCESRADAVARAKQFALVLSD